MDAPKQRVRPLPQGWYSIDSHHRGHKDTKENVLAEIENDTNLDPDVKTLLLAKIKAMDCKALTVHFHSMPEKGEFNITIHLKPLF